MKFPRRSASNAILRSSVAFAFLYPAIDAVFEPNNWLGFFPDWAMNVYMSLIGTPLHLSDLWLLHSFGLVEVTLALWVLFGKHVRIPAILMAALLVAIVVTHADPGDFSILFRDVSIALAAIALAAANERCDACAPDGTKA